MDTNNIKVEGYVTKGFELVKEVFKENIQKRGDLGASLSLFRHGEKLIDIWGGLSDPAKKSPWTEKTKGYIFSGSKGIVAIALMKAMDLGLLDITKPISYYWPEFSKNGKSAVTIQQAMTYMAGMPCINKKISDDDILDYIEMANILAEQPIDPDQRVWPVLYGPFTCGWIGAEVIRRVCGMNIKDAFHEIVAKPLNLDMGFGIEPHEEDNVARIEYGTNFLRLFDEFTKSGDDLSNRIWSNPAAFPQDHNKWNDPKRWLGIIPPVNVIGTARSISKLYSVLAVDAVRPKGDSEAFIKRDIMDLARTYVVNKEDAIMKINIAYGGTGFRLRSVPRPGPDGNAFGHDGGGGSAHLAWPRCGIGVSYVPNRLVALGPDDKRASSLMKAIVSCIEGRGMFKLLD